ncbi:hypothetical protein UFOVP420_49 [uncultured Caudovirales phage]|uniref:Uncharacterized protein n=1 Tax=uncultured Caudovirales phage TaxID=2100421 RepID=A0A6J5M3Y9_9CAUD|nr:hypothetical protein UFOVP420_49 [uncultured Caudovirales phage]
MTPGQLIDLLEKAGMLKEESPGVLGWHPTMEKAERFAAFVAAAEREACAKLCDDWPNGRDDVYSIGVAIRARGQE